MSNTQIAETILEQLGGNRFRAMTGASHFLATERGLRFKLPARFARDGIRIVSVELNGGDLYDVRFMRWNGRALSAPVTVAESADVFCGDLPAVFTRATGLDTRL